MFCSIWKRVALGLAVVAAVAVTNANQAEAHLFGHHGSSGGSSGGYYGSSGGSSGGWYGYGSSGGSYGGGHHHHWGSSGGSSGGWYGYGSSGGSSGGWYGYGSSGGSSGGYYSSAVSYSDGCECGYEGGSYAAPMIYGTPTPGPAATPAMPATPTPPMGTSTQYGVDAAMLLVNVPADAKIYVNGNATSSTGVQRQYISRNLEAGHSYGYEIKAEMVVDGKVVSQTKSVRLVPGQSMNVSFESANVASQPIPADIKVSTAPATNKTTLKLHVPADAKVSLAGIETSSRGEDREFISSKLASGAAWDNYTVRVIVDQNGKTVVKEQTISLIGGETRELSFDFAGASVADVANVSVR